MGESIRATPVLRRSENGAGCNVQWCCEIDKRLAVVTAPVDTWNPEKKTARHLRSSLLPNRPKHPLRVIDPISDSEYTCTRQGLPMDGTTKWRLSSPIDHPTTQVHAQWACWQRALKEADKSWEECPTGAMRWESKYSNSRGIG